MVCIICFCVLLEQTCTKTLNPVWKEEYEFHIYYDQTTTFEVEVYDYDMASKDDFMGK